MSNKSNPVKTGHSGSVEPRSDKSDIDAFICQAKVLVPYSTGKRRLILALDATMSRQPTWDLACEIQAQMFDAVHKADALQVQLVYYRGFGECAASRFVDETEALKKLMTQIDCRGGHTQIRKVLAHTLKQHAKAKVNALVFIGDAVEEKVDDLAVKAGELGLKGVPVFVFQEGNDLTATHALKEIARLSGGAWFRFDRNAADALAKLLSAVAVFATGGRKALAARNRPEDRLMLEHLSGDKR